jgi:hypothetical protein
MCFFPCNKGINLVFCSKYSIDLELELKGAAYFKGSCVEFAHFGKVCTQASNAAPVYWSNIELFCLLAGWQNYRVRATHQREG